MEKIKKIKTGQEAWKYINKYRRSREGIDEDISEEEWRNHFMEILEGTEHKECRKTGRPGEEEKTMEERDDNIEKEDIPAKKLEGKESNGGRQVRKRGMEVRTEGSGGDVMEVVKENMEWGEDTGGVGKRGNMPDI